MTVRFILIAVIVAASGAMGMTLSENIRQGFEKQKRLREGLKRTAMSMVHRGKTLAEALSDGAAADAPTLAEIGAVIRKNPTLPVRKTAEVILGKDKAISGRCATDGARFIERIALAAVGADIEAALSDYEREAETYFSELEEKCRKRMRLIRSLSLMGGMAVAVMIA